MEEPDGFAPFLLCGLAGRDCYCWISVRIYDRLERCSNLDYIRHVGIVKPRGYISIDEFAWFEVHCKVHESVTEVVGPPILHA